MKKSIIFGIIFAIFTFIFILCISSYTISFIYTSKYGDSYYHSKVTENIIVLNYGQNIKKISYCFTNEDKCTDYLNYDGDLSKRLIVASIDYPDSTEKIRLCYKITSTIRNITNCNDDSYVVDSQEPVIESLYSEIIIDEDIEDLENLFEVSSNTGIKSFSCYYEDNFINCEAIGNNSLVSNYSKQVSIATDNPLEGKSVLFVGDSITYASSTYDNFKGWSGRVGLSNYMDWYNSAVNGATIAKTNRSHITDQIMDNKDNDYDYIILQGGINDYGTNVDLGKISDSYEVDDFDNTTFAGGLEELFYYTKKYNENSKIGFIITYQTPGNEEHCNREEQVELMRQICEKWDISYLDLYDGVVYEKGNSYSYSELLRVDTGEYFYEEDPTQIHLNGLGYDVVSKYITIWMKTL